MTQLSVNLNKIALLRNSRGRDFPNPVDFARLAMKNGAVGVTIHPRPDERHARYSDIQALQNVVNEFKNKELNIEGYPTDQLNQAVLEAEPDQYTLVPDEPNQITSDHGWDLTKHFDFVKKTIAPFKNTKTRISLFLDPDKNQIDLAVKLGVARIELYTESYAVAFDQKNYEQVLEQFMNCADYALSLGLEVNAGHDLDLENLPAFVQKQNVDEVSIGHALIVESLLNGFENTIKKYVAICKPK
ncbi:MAG: pyridoxine 5'-phosphate synthase [Saccharospirillaceae bacterium]|nr:pyridoxine 5'-phosphate synthase [Pseudomonadales bacterium]NRB80969.1 pyridoxine 5'-phosphate synthase [Saccharospirillaceae bacterium]